MYLNQQKLKWNKQWQLHYQDQPSQDMLYELLCKRHMQHYHKKYLQKYLHTLLCREWFREESLTLFRWACWLVTERPSCHTCPSVIKLGSYIFPKEDPELHKPRDTPLGFCRHQHYDYFDYVFKINYSRPF